MNPGVVDFSSTTHTVVESGVALTLTVHRSGGSDGSVSVNYVTNNGSAQAGMDYSAATGTFAWADGDTSSRTFQVAILNDSNIEEDETFHLTLSVASGFAILGTAAAAATIHDDDSALVGAPTLSGEMMIALAVALAAVAMTTVRPR